MDQAWIGALDRLEADIVAAEQLLERLDPAAVPTWTAPVLEGALPPELLGRARELHRRHEVVLAALAEATARSMRQLSLTDRIGRATRRSTRSVYVDTSA